MEKSFNSNDYHQLHDTYKKDKYHAKHHPDGRTMSRRRVEEQVPLASSTTPSILTDNFSTAALEHTVVPRRSPRSAYRAYPVSPEQQSKKKKQKEKKVKGKLESKLSGANAYVYQANSLSSGDVSQDALTANTVFSEEPTESGRNVYQQSVSHTRPEEHDDYTHGDGADGDARNNKNILAYDDTKLVAHHGGTTSTP